MLSYVTLFFLILMRLENHYVANVHRNRYLPLKVKYDAFHFLVGLHYIWSKQAICRATAMQDIGAGEKNSSSAKGNEWEGKEHKKWPLLVPRERENKLDCCCWRAKATHNKPFNEPITCHHPLKQRTLRVPSHFIYDGPCEPVSSDCKTVKYLASWKQDMRVLQDTSIN